MKTLPYLFFTLLINFSTYSQNINGRELLRKAIQYHDPGNNWDTFSGSFNVTMKTPNHKNRNSSITIDLPKEHFYLKTHQDTLITEYKIDNNKCTILLNGNTNPSNTLLKKHNITCKRGQLLKNYYTYLYGLPMKLKDPGTIINDTISQKRFNGKDYLVLQVSYDKTVGNDVWYFYFNPKTYAMEVYQFYKTDETGNIKEQSGEYILLTEEMVINGIKMPKNRAWYYNKDSSYLGTDILSMP
ncbi:DUF6503 family protein [Snuella sedimenti]|uniref:Uncharacterized protein n=1 Tax=Snuella sedimenti TaxID=2798802 RepID=A0A8J7LMH9_9FLAO|nr:DUF6503 family protein [Snuella sedimenti]MBJ6366733.1 hypothetical protein [Snuella sedimenti]